MRILFLLGSGRRDGNSASLARHAARASGAAHESHLLRLGDYPLPPFVDYRRTDYARLLLGANEQRLLDETLAADVIALATPLYWYTVSESTKRYLDHWSTWMRLPGLDFRERLAGKVLCGLTAMAGPEPAEAAPMVEQLRLTAAYMRMSFGGVALAHAGEMGEAAADQMALNRAADMLAEAIRLRLAYP